MTPIAYFMIFGLLAGLMASVIFGLWWAVKNGHFANFQKGALSIFDKDEPVGYRTDAFPGEEPKKPSK